MLSSSIFSGGLPGDQCEMLYVTATGKLELETELACLQHMRQQAVAEWRQVMRVHLPGDREVAAKAADITELDREISRLKAALARARLVANASRVVGVGSRVCFKDEHGEEMVVSIVGALAANPRGNLLAYESPLGRSLLGHTIGDTVNVHSLGQSWWVQIVRVEEMPNGSFDEQLENNRGKRYAAQALVPG